MYLCECVSVCLCICVSVCLCIYVSVCLCIWEDPPPDCVHTPRIVCPQGSNRSPVYEGPTRIAGSWGHFTGIRREATAYWNVILTDIRVKNEMSEL